MDPLERQTNLIHPINDSKAAIAIPMDEEFNSKIPILNMSPHSQIMFNPIWS